MSRTARAEPRTRARAKAQPGHERARLPACLPESTGTCGSAGASASVTSTCVLSEARRVSARGPDDQSSLRVSGKIGHRPRETRTMRSSSHGPAYLTKLSLCRVGQWHFAPQCCVWQSVNWSRRTRSLSRLATAGGHNAPWWACQGISRIRFRAMLKRQLAFQAQPLRAASPAAA